MFIYELKQRVCQHVYIITVSLLDLYHYHFCQVVSLIKLQFNQKVLNTKQ